MTSNKYTILHLFNTYRWYDMIERGEKPEEYRSSDTWKKQICSYTKSNHSDVKTARCLVDCPFMTKQCHVSIKTDITHVCFHRGYSNTTMTWSVRKIRIGKGNPQWGAPKENVFIIELNERIDK